MATAVSARTRAMPQPPRFVYKIINPAYMAILRSPLHRLLDRWLIVLVFTGRKTGKAYRVPVGYGYAGESLYVATDARWKHNFEGGAAVRVWLHGRERQGVATILADADPDALRAGYRPLIAARPLLGRVMGIAVAMNGAINETDIARAQARGFRMICVPLGVSP